MEGDNMDQLFSYYRAIQSIRYQSLKKYLESHSYTKDEMKEILDPVLETLEFTEEPDKESVPCLEVMKPEFWNVFYELYSMELVFKFIIDSQKDPNTEFIVPVCMKHDEDNDSIKSYIQ